MKVCPRRECVIDDRFPRVQSNYVELVLGGPGAVAEALMRFTNNS